MIGELTNAGTLIYTSGPSRTLARKLGGMMGAKEIEQAKARLAELAKKANDSWDDQVALLKAAVALIDSGDLEAQRFILDQVRSAATAETAGILALALVGEAEPGPVDLAKKLRLSPARVEVIRELESLLPTASGSVLQAAVTAVLVADRERAVEIFSPHLKAAGPNLDAQARERVGWIATMALDGKPLRPLVELVFRTVARLDDQRITQRLFYVCGNAAPEWEAELAHLLEIDLPPELVYKLVRYAATSGRVKVDARRRKRLLPLFQAAAAHVRADPSARARLEQAEKALELPGSLLSPTPVKAPKPPPRVALKHGAATDGGPVLALPVEAVREWRGTLAKNGKPAEGDFSGTDYGRACDVSGGKTPWGPYGFVDVGKHRGLVLGTSCEFAKLKDGSCLLVMEGEEEDVAALLKEQKSWKKLDGALSLPSGQFVLFDSAYERAATHKTKVTLAPGKYAVDEYDEDDGRSLWIVRLTPAK